ncbi:hypothetical protein AAC387_Pa02g4903 [Persea americana]
MGRPQEEAPSPAHPQPQNTQFTAEEGRPYNPQEISPPASYPPGNENTPQPPFQPPPPPQPQALNPSPYPPQNQPTNAAYQPQPAPYPPNNASYPLQPAPHPAQNTPNNTAYPPQPAPYPPNSPKPEFSTPAGYGPQPVSYPPPNPSTAVPQQYPPPPPSPYKSLQHDGAAQGFPVQQQFQPAQVPHPYHQNAGTMSWSTGIFDCMADPMNALVTACVPCLTFGQIAEIVDGGNTSCGTSAIIYGAIAFFIGIPCLLSCTYRTKLRNKYALVESPAPDWITHFFCEWCALCQEYRELKARGLDPDLGWHGNMAKNQQPQVAMAPPMHQSMMG